MSVVSTLYKYAASIAVSFCFCVVIFTGASAETAKVSKSATTSSPIISGWEPVKRTKPATHGWNTVAKSAVLLRKLNKLTDEDYAAALQAVHHALSEVADGKIYRWKRADNKLHGKVMPTNVFRDKEGRVCRHLIYTLSIEKYRKTVEGIACRSLNGNWNLSG